MWSMGSLVNGDAVGCRRGFGGFRGDSQMGGGCAGAVGDLYLRIVKITLPVCEHFVPPLVGREADLCARCCCVSSTLWWSEATGPRGCGCSAICAGLRGE